MSGNSGAWGVAMWKDGYSDAGGLQLQEQGISLEGGDPVLPYLPTTPLGCLLVPPDGLGVPPVRSGDVAFAQRDGVVQFADYYEPRQLTFQVRVQNDNCPGCDTSPEVEGVMVLPGGSPGRAFTPDSPAISITGDLDVAIDLALDQWPPPASTAGVSQWVTGGNGRGWTTRINTTGTLALFWSPDGIASLSATSTIPVSLLDGARIWLRYTLDVDNGAGGRDIAFYTSTDGVNWTQLGATVTQAGVTSIFNTTAEMAVGAYNEGGSERLAGRVYSVVVRSGIGGTIVANPNFAVQPAGTTMFVDGAGNTWTVVSPAFLVAFVAAVMSARQKVSRLTQEWSRNCSGATLVLFTDCHDPAATEEEKVYLGPYLVHGRPRVADVVWERSNRGSARVTLRFDAADARLVLADTIPGSIWTSEHVQSVDAAEQNLAQNYHLQGLTMAGGGAGVFEDSFPASGGPDGGPYFRRHVVVPNTTSPMAMATTGSGTAAIPITAGLTYQVSWWARKDPFGGVTTRTDIRWYDGAGVQVGATIASSTADPANEWERITRSFVAPVGAAFLRVDLVWTGTALADQDLDFAQVWINEGAAATGPETVEVVGTLCACPVITLFPTMTAPIVVTYGTHEFTYNADVTSVVTIDTRWGRAAEGSTDVTQNLSGDYSACLPPGVHDVTVQTGDPTDTGFVNIVWENSVVSG